MRASGARPRPVPASRRSGGLAAGLAALAMAMLAPDAPARPFDPERPWFAEGGVGSMQNGPDGSNLGVGQNYQVHLGFHPKPWADLALGLAWAHGRVRRAALETDVASGGLRGRAWIGAGRWSPYAEAGLRLYHFDVRRRDVVDPIADTALKVGGMAGGGLLYARSTWWLGVGAEVHGAIGDAGIEGGDLVTYTAYNLFVGRPLSW